MIENKKAILVINQKEYEIKFTIGFWKEIQAECGVTRENLEKKLNESFATVATKMVMLGIKYALSQEQNPEITEKDIEYSLDASIVDVFEQAMINGMTLAEKKLLKAVQEKQDKQFKELTEEPEKKN